MESNPKGTGMKKFTNILSRSSQKFMAAFFDESGDEQKALEEIQRKVQLAIAQKSLAVLQIKPAASSAPLETISGWLFANQHNADSIIIKTQQDNQMRMIPIKQIRKISVNSRTGKRALAD